MANPLTITSRLDVWRDIMSASGIDSYDYDKADAAFAAFISNRQRNKKPPPWNGEELDSVNCYLGLSGHKKACSPLHGFYLLTRGAKTWDDVTLAVDVLGGVPGLANIRLPDEVIAIMAEKMDEQQRAAMPPEGTMENTIFEGFDVICTYTREDAFEDGTLVDLSDADGVKGHFAYPLACTAAVWAIIEAAIESKEHHNDITGVLHDICWMTRFGKVVDESTRLFDVIITGAGSTHPESVFTFKIVCHPGTNAEPVLTIMLPEED